MTFQGLYTVLVTPFNAAGALDEKALRHNIRFQIEQGADGIVALGTTGETPTLTTSEKERIIHIAVEEAKGKVKVVVGSGSYSTAETIAETRLAERLGADAALIVTPYYNKPTQEGLYLHFKAITDATRIPIILYNIQGRTGINLQTDTLRRLIAFPNIIGVKESSFNMVQIGEVIEMVREYRPNFSVFSGDDALTFGVMTLGGVGVLSVASNLFPAELKLLVQLLLNSEIEQARDLHFKLLPLFRTLFIETNPMPIKAAMNMCGMSVGKCRLPLCDLLPDNERKLKNMLHEIVNERIQNPEFRIQNKTLQEVIT